MPKLVDEIFRRGQGDPQRPAMTVLIVEQRMAECLDIADRAYILQTGRVLMQGRGGGDQGQPGCAEGVFGAVSRVPDALQRFFTLLRKSRDRTKRRASVTGPGSAAHRFAKCYAPALRSGGTQGITRAP